MIGYAFCAVPAAPVRSEPSHRSEMINQLLFGEAVALLEEKEEWLRIRSLADGYEGWLTNHLVEEAAEAVAQAPMPFVACGLLNPFVKNGLLYQLPLGASLPQYDAERQTAWGGHFKGAARNTGTGYDAALLPVLVRHFLNAPYLWGGRTLMGIDCSGFVQVVFKVLGVPLLRDAWQQAEEGQPVMGVAAATAGDLAFFRNHDGRIVHVGIVMGSGEVAHASGKVRIDRLTEAGIVQPETGRQTHTLHSIRRVV